MTEGLAHEGDGRNDDGEYEQKDKAESHLSAVSAATGVVVSVFVARVGAGCCVEVIAHVLSLRATTVVRQVLVTLVLRGHLLPRYVPVVNDEELSHDLRVLIEALIRREVSAPPA